MGNENSPLAWQIIRFAFISRSFSQGSMLSSRRFESHWKASYDVNESDGRLGSGSRKPTPVDGFLNASKISSMVAERLNLGGSCRKLVGGMERTIIMRQSEICWLIYQSSLSSLSRGAFLDANVNCSAISCDFVSIFEPDLFCITWFELIIQFHRKSAEFLWFFYNYDKTEPKWCEPMKDINGRNID